MLLKTHWAWNQYTFALAFAIEPSRDDDGAIKHDVRWQTYRKAIAGEEPHRYGRGPFCDFPIPRGLPEKAGVYTFMIGDRVMYVGRSGDRRGLRKRLFEYHRISPRQSFKGGPRTTCYVNAQICKRTSAGDEVSVYVLATDSSDDLERSMIHDLGHPPWNLDRCAICRCKNQV
jgi:hypothetical protein